MPIVGKWLIPGFPKSAMGFVIFCRFATVSKRSTDVPPDRSEWQELIVKRSRSLLYFRGRFSGGNMLRLSISEFTAFDGCAPRKSAMLELLQGHAHMRGSICWVLQTSVNGARPAF